MERRRVGVGRGGGHEMAGDPADDRDEQHAERGPFAMEAAVGVLHHQHAAEDRAAEDGDIGAGLDQAGAAEHFVLLRCCGRMAYLIGPKKVEWMPIANSAASSSGMLCEQQPGARRRA